MCNFALIKAQVPQGQCANKAPGFTKIYLAEAKWVSGYPDELTFNSANTATAKVVTGDITFDTATYPDAGWYEWDFQPKTLDLIQEAQGETGAKYYQTRLPGKIAGHHPLVDQALDDSRDLDLVALMLDKDGKPIRVGSPSNPLNMEVLMSKYGTRAGEESGFDVELQVDTHNRLWPYYEGAIAPLI